MNNNLDKIIEMLQKGRRYPVGLIILAMLLCFPVGTWLLYRRLVAGGKHVGLSVLAIVDAFSALVSFFSADFTVIYFPFLLLEAFIALKVAEKIKSGGSVSSTSSSSQNTTFNGVYHEIKDDNTGSTSSGSYNNKKEETYKVVCPHCGGQNDYTTGKTNICDFCGSKLPDNM